MLYAPCALRYFEVTMPAIASLEDLKAAQKKGLSIYAMLYALPVLRSPAGRDVGGCSMRYGNGAG